MRGYIKHENKGRLVWGVGGERKKANNGSK